MAISTNVDFTKTVIKNLSSKSDFEQDASEAIGNRLAQAESKFMQMVSDPKATEGQIQAAQQEYMKVSRVFQALSEIFKAADQLLRDVIRKLSVS